MYCPNCGARIPDGARFCSNCGFNLSGTDGTPSYERTVRMPYAGQQASQTVQQPARQAAPQTPRASSQTQVSQTDEWAAPRAAVPSPPQQAPYIPGQSDTGVYQQGYTQQSYPQQGYAQQESQRKKRGSLLVVVIVVALVAALGGGGYAWWRSNQAAEQARIEAEQQAEAERRAAEEQAEQERLEAERKAEEERKAAEEQAERERQEAERQAEEERQAAERQAAAVDAARNRGLQVVSGTIRIFNGEELAEYQGQDLETLFGPDWAAHERDEVYVILILDAPQTLSCQYADGSGTSSDTAAMLHIDDGNADAWRELADQEVTIAFDANKAWWPSDVRLPLGEPAVSEVELINA